MIDPGTVAVLSGLIVTLCSISFVVNTTLRRNDAVGRLWSAAFTTGILQTLAYIVWSVQPAAWWALAVGNASFVIAIGMMWSGCRAANARRPLIGIPLLAGLAVGVATMLRGPDGGPWAGAVEMFIAIAVLSGLSALETTIARLRHNLNARTLTVVFTVVSLFYVARTAMLIALGPGNPIFESYFGSIPAILINLSLVVLATIALSTLQAERFGPRGRVDAASDTGDIDGITGPRMFRELAESWLLRSVRERATLVLMIFDLANLEEINIAFGRSAGDRAIRMVGRVAATQAPAAALVGHLAPDRFAVLVPLPSNEDIAAVADRISAAIINSSLDDADRFRASTFVGIASTHTSGSRYDGLVEAAVTAANDAAAEVPLGDLDVPAGPRWPS